MDGQKVIGKKIYVNELLENNYLINDVVGANGEDCSDSYLVVKMQDDSYKYDVCLMCDGTAYSDKETKICEITDDELVININNDVNFDVEDKNVPTCTINATPDVVLKEKLLEIVSSNKNIEYYFDDINYGANKTKKINSAGTYKA